MPTIHVVNRCEIQPSFRVQQAAGMFDLHLSSESNTEFSVELPPLDAPWHIGVIVGPSGSGKTTVARAAFADQFESAWTWPADRSLLDAFPADLPMVDICELLCSVGFSSPPSWLRPFSALSNGEQFRVNLARTLAERRELAVVDEFTSVVDRTVARIGSAAVAKTVRRRQQKFVAVTCHYDVLPWLQPDWILDMADGSLRYFAENTCDLVSLRRPFNFTQARPEIQLRIQRAHSSAWKIFHRHHYLSASLHPAAQCFVGSVEDRPAAFVATLPFPHPIVPGWREHRCVCLPDFLGVGIGSAMSEYVASLYAATGRPYTSVSGHPAIIRHRARSKMWQMTRAPSRIAARQSLGNLQSTSSSRRMTASFRFIGPPNPADARGFGLRAVA